MNLRHILAPAVLAALQAAPAQTGNERLVPFPDLAGGSGFVVAGTGMAEQPSTFILHIPEHAEVRQVIAYWAGQSNSTTSGIDDAILLDGIDVRGQLAGGPAAFFTASNRTFYTMTFRADITDLGIVRPGPNSITASGMAFGALFAANKGVAIVVVYDDRRVATLSTRTYAPWLRPW